MMSNTPTKRRQPRRRAVLEHQRHQQIISDEALARKVAAEWSGNNTTVHPPTKTNNSRKTTTRQSNTSNNDTNQQTISTRRSSTTTANNTTTTTGLTSNDEFDGAPSTSISTTGTQDDTPLDTNTTTPNNIKLQQKIPTSHRSIIANDTTTSTTSPFVFDSASRPEPPNKSLLTNSTSTSKGGTSGGNRKRVLKEDVVKKKSTTTASGGGDRRSTRRRRSTRTISTTPQCAQVSTKYPPSQYNNNSSSNKKKASKKDVKKKSTTGDVVPGDIRRKRRQHGSATDTTTSYTIAKQYTTKSSSGKTTSPLALQSPNKDKDIGGRGKPRRIVKVAVDKKKVLFSPSPRSSTNDNARTKRNVGFYADSGDSGSEYEEEDDASTFSYNSDSDYGKKPRAKRTKKKSQKRKMNELDESNESKPPAKKKRTGGPKNGTEEFEKEWLGNLEWFDKLRTEWEEKNPTNPHGYHMSPFRKELNSGPHQIPLQVDKGSELWGLLKIPNDLYTNPEKYPNEYIYLFNLLVTHYDNVKDIKSAGGQELLRILFSIPWDEPLGVDDPLVLALLNYCTMETALRLAWGEHPGRKTKEDSSELSARAWNWILDSVGEIIYPRLVLGDVDDLAYMKDTKLSDLLSPRDQKRHLKSWNNVLKGANKVCDHVAPLSKDTAEKWGERVHGSVSALERHFRDNPGKIISANPNKLTVPSHPSASYEKKKWSNMHTQGPENESAMTNLRRKFRGHEEDKCTHNRGLFDKNKKAFAQAQAAFEDGQALGRENNSKLHKLKKAVANRAKSILGEEADVDAIFKVGIYGQIENLLTKYEKELYAWALLREDTEDGVMKKMKQYANIMVSGHDTFDKARKAVKNNTADDEQQDMVDRQQAGAEKGRDTFDKAREAVKDGTADDDQEDMVVRHKESTKKTKDDKRAAAFGLINVDPTKLKPGDVSIPVKCPKCDAVTDTDQMIKSSHEAQPNRKPEYNVYMKDEPNKSIFCTDVEIDGETSRKKQIANFLEGHLENSRGCGKSTIGTVLPRGGGTLQGGNVIIERESSPEYLAAIKKCPGCNSSYRPVNPLDEKRSLTIDSMYVMKRYRGPNVEK